MSTSVAKSWNTIHQWLDLHAPSVRATLNPPVTGPALEKLRTTVGRELPADFVESYRIHDGSDRNSGPIIGVPLLSVGRIAREMKFIRPKRGQNIPPDVPMSARPGAIKEVAWSADWIPFVGPDEQNYLALDFDPGPTGTPGQVISFGADQYIYGTPRYVLAPSFREFMEFVAELFAHGQVEVIPDDPDCEFLQLCRRRDNGVECSLLTGISMFFEDER
jgi:cell wall assembly regulator SMI1